MTHFYFLITEESRGCQRKEYTRRECLSSKDSKVRSHYPHRLSLNVAVVEPIQGLTVIKDYIIKLQVRGQELKE